MAAAGSGAPIGSASSSVGFPKEAPPSVIALLDGLKAGEELEGWKVAFIMVPTSGPKSFVVGLEKADARFNVTVGLPGSAPFSPNLSTDKYGLYFDDGGDAGASADRSAVVKALQARIKKTEGTVPTPEIL